MKITILGAGTVGAIIARDLAGQSDLEVTACDANPARLTPLKSHQIETRKIDLARADAIEESVKDADIVVGALPGFLGFKMLKTLIELGKRIVDVSFMPENPLSLNDMAQKHGVSVVVDMGVAPGMSNFLVGHAVSELESVEEIKIYVGGLPVDRKLPFQYKAPFSPIDVIEEYTRPARYVDYGHIHTVPALSDVELIDFPGIGTLEAFFTDGLRTLLYTVKVPHMVEKTMRYPGHAALISTLKSIGFFNDGLVDAGEVKARPIDLTSTLLLDCWRIEPEDREFTAMRVIIRGSQGGQKRQYSYELVDFKDEATGNTSMARTTGFPCAVATRLMADDLITTSGIIVPEILGQNPDIFTKVMEALKDRGIRITETITDL
ncbi:MAG TPA: saccharopine dehydrogenase C-terminal domain-containing protein [Thermoanaerobaculia bacterium]|nr:saccharopine dehydrogenase C-terminal domain-containing protein [Thermoanaerobaculia bacterium]HUM30604.1 saccharopine dehydrogenase C-terminal domain-containing protein [Thermoanaerobaculia bacterium]HXK68868.1 saccharopine dehydrogenase C-terminal domain-containing protein [Thermoanaerobaculia bacterium]